jgi:hypothetical protein
MMVTSSEIVVTATIWILTSVGGFFGLRGAVRRKKAKHKHAARNKKSV